MEARTLALISQRQQEQKQRRTSKNPCSRFQNNTPEGKKRRANRIFMHKMRKAATKKHVAPRRTPRKKAPALHSLASAICGTHRNAPVACCGRRKESCHCYDSGTGLTLRKACKKAVINALVRRVRKSPIQTWRDTADMSEYAKQIKCKKLKHLFPTAFMWRHFSNKHLWEALVKNGAVKHDGPPSWALVRSTLEIFVLHNQPVHGGFFYSGNILRKYRFCTTGTWTDCKAAGMGRIETEVVALRIVWRVARKMQGALDSLHSNPTRIAWRRCTETFMNELNERTDGIFGHYSMKLALDGILVSRPALMKVCSWWPMLCPAYMSELPHLYPGLKRKQEDLFLAACHYHRMMRENFPKMSISESLAQLCWKKRNVT